MQTLEKEVQAPPKPAEPESGGDPASRRLLVLLHGQKASDDLVRGAIARLRSEGHRVTVRVTYEAGDVDRLVREALELKTADTLVAAGGDGTICEVVDALLKHTGGIKDTRDVSDPQDTIVRAHGDPPTADAVSVAILPLGTSNDFAATTGLPEDPYHALLLATQRSSMRRIDVGLLNGKVFMNTATIGASADAGKITSVGMKKILGPFAFLFTGVRAMRNWKPVASIICFPNINMKESGNKKHPEYKPDSKGPPLADVLGQTESVNLRSADSMVDHSGHSVALDRASSFVKGAVDQVSAPIGEIRGVPLLHLTAANNRQIASMIAISPDAVLDDGMLDCVYLTGGAGQHLRRVLLDLVRKGAARTKMVTTLLRVPWLEVTTEAPTEWSLDGDPMPDPTTNFRFSLLHRAVNLHLPDDRMLVAGQPLPEVEEGAATPGKRKKAHHDKSNPSRLPRGRMRAPSLRTMMGSVIRFRKKKNWGAIIRNTIGATLRLAVVASIGGLLVHQYHLRKNTPTVVVDEPETTLDRKAGRQLRKQRRLEAKQLKAAEAK